MFQKSITSFFIILFFLILFICIFSIHSETFSGYTKSSNSEFIEDSSFHYSENSIFSWPLFGYYNISSFFGYRISPIISFIALLLNVVPAATPPCSTTVGVVLV